MLTTAGDLIYKDIVYDPHDDGLRLIYADWLEDNDAPDHAEFIRERLAGREGLRAFNRLADGYAKRLSSLVGGETCSYGIYRAKPGETESDYGVPDGTPYISVRCRVSPARVEYAYFLFGRGLADAVALPLKVWEDRALVLAKCHPLSAVLLTDKTPGRATADDEAIGGVGWYGAEVPSLTAADEIPLHIWEKIPLPISQAYPYRVKIAPSVRDAKEALSVGCLVWARGKDANWS